MGRERETDRERPIDIEDNHTERERENDNSQNGSFSGQDGRGRENVVVVDAFLSHLDILSLSLPLLLMASFMRKGHSHFF